ncbi:hypothetical protein [Nostoc sp.]|uniref:hypothetical protein n=1 Tax=Nostoc sp. TaxID=1180 RepID=UPI002FF87A14
MNKTKVNLGIIPETLLIPLWARACDLQAADPIIVDPKSSEIIAAIDYESDQFTTAKLSQIGCCLRGTILDNWVCTYINIPKVL